jgi:hypothetical protein
MRANILGQFGSSANASGRRKHSVVGLVLSAAVALASVCASAGSQPRLIPFPDTEHGTVRPDGPITGYPSALAAVSSVMESTMGFPPLEGALRLYPNKLSLAAGIIREGYDASYASQMAGAIRGIGTPGNILLNESALRGLSWSAKTALLAHELTHVAEYKLADGRRSNLDQWLREGLAEWVAWQVMDSLKLGSQADRRQLAVANLRKARRHDQLPVFDELLAARAWLALPDHQLPGLMYDEAFLAADLLIARHGLASTLEYFRLVGGSDDHLANFKQAFGENRWSFHQAFMAHLQRLLGS